MNSREQGLGFIRTDAELRRLRTSRQRARAALRAAAIAAAWPFARAAEALRGPGNALRVVLYHHVFDDQVDGFRRQLGYLGSRFEFTDLDGFLRFHRGEEPFRGGKLLVTFDDGFKDNLTNALDVLDEFGVKAVFFVATDFVSLASGDEERYRSYARDVFHTGGPVENLTWDDLREILRRGHRVGSHTVTHRRMTGLSVEEAVKELEESRRTLSSRLDVAATEVSFPYGRELDRRSDLAVLARRAGYRACFSAIRGANRPGGDPYDIRRDALDPSWPLVQVKFFLSRR